MKRNFLPEYVGIAMSKSQFCFCTGCTPYRLRTILQQNPKKWEKIGVHQYDKFLMPAAIRELLAITGLRIDVDYYTQYVAGQRGIKSPMIEH